MNFLKSSSSSRKNKHNISRNRKSLRLSVLAQDDLKNIANFTQYQWGKEQKKNYLNLIKKSFNLLCISSSAIDNEVIVHMGKHRPEISTGLYSYTIKKHNVFYRENSKEFIIVRVLHTRMEPIKHFD